jgi:hypothetical protein
LASNLLVQQACGGFLFVDDGVDVCADVRDELWAESDVGVVAFDGFFDLVDVDVPASPDAVACVAAEEVQVLVAVSTHPNEDANGSSSTICTDGRGQISRPALQPESQ